MRKISKPFITIIGLAIITSACSSKPMELNSLPPNDSSPNDQWTVSSGEYEDMPIVYSRNTSAEEYIGDQKYPYQIGIAIPLKTPLETGLPSSEENKIFFAIEDDIIAAFEANKGAILTLVISTNGMKEFVLYSTSDDGVVDKIAALQAAYPDYVFTHTINHDPDWSIYQEFVEDKLAD
jgi:hypothetical protein